MFCPLCATPNADDVKFCRSCGKELEAVALALSGQSAKPSKGGANQVAPQTARDLAEKHIEGVSSITRGSILLGVSLLVGAAMALFAPAVFSAPWMLLWMVFFWVVLFGWMAVWGGIQMAYGISGVLEAKSRLRLLGLSGVRPSSDILTPDSLSHDGAPQIANAHAAYVPAPRGSVTEGTTRLLDDTAEK